MDALSGFFGIRHNRVTSSALDTSVMAKQTSCHNLDGVFIVMLVRHGVIRECLVKQDELRLEDALRECSFSLSILEVTSKSPVLD